MYVCPYIPLGRTYSHEIPCVRTRGGPHGPGGLGRDSEREREKRERERESLISKSFYSRSCPECIGVWSRLVVLLARRCAAWHGHGMLHKTAQSPYSKWGMDLAHGMGCERHTDWTHDNCLAVHTWIAWETACLFSMAKLLCTSMYEQYLGS